METFTADELLKLEAAVSASLARYRARVEGGDALGLEMRRWEALQAKLRALSDAVTA